MTASDDAGLENGGYPPRPLPQKPNPDLPFRNRLKLRLTSEIDTKWADVILIGCFMCAGIIDSVAFNVYACFVSMQTGNTIFVGLGVSGQPSTSPSFAWTKSLTAILAFCLGALCFATYHRLASPSPRTRWVLLSSFLLQTLLVAVAASLVTAGVVSDRTKSFEAKEAESRRRVSTAPFPYLDLLPIGLLAFQSAGQVVASRVLRYNALPTVVLTSLYCDLMSDAHLLTAGLFEDPQRNRRACAAVALFLGAVMGGFLSKSWVGYAGALWIAAAIKATMVLAWLLWKAKGRECGSGEGELRRENG